MEPIDLSFTIAGKEFISKLILFPSGDSVLFEVVNIKPFDGRIKPPYLFIPNQITKTLPCSKNYFDKDLTVTDAIEVAIRKKCEELNISIFDSLPQ